MEHPLIGSINDLSIDELHDKVSELNKKLAIAARMGNGQLCDQIRMALETYSNKLREKQDEQYNNATQQNFKDKINIS